MCLCVYFLYGLIIDNFEYIYSKTFKSISYCKIEFLLSNIILFSHKLCAIVLRFLGTADAEYNI